MEEVLQKSFIAGLDRLVARAGLLDSINVFPIADGDTGRNLSVSLLPLRGIGQSKEKIAHELLLSARGNSGNIASQFFSVFCGAENVSAMADLAAEGARKAWQAVSNPRTGTMLSAFDALAAVLTTNVKSDKQTVDTIIGSLERAVHETHKQLPRLREAGVVDAGALGMYIFFEGFFLTLAGNRDDCRPVTETFKGRLKISSSFEEKAETGYCVDFVVKAPHYSPDEIKIITSVQEDVIIIPEGDYYKIHLHTENKEDVRSQIDGLGKVINWDDDNLTSQVQEFHQANIDRAFHIMTDAAGSLTLRDAKKYGITLLSSYLTIGDKSLPETYFHPEELYKAMINGMKASTSQASVYERHQFYESVLERFEKVLYLCVGSVFTGNYETVMQWKKAHDKDNRLLVIDTGAASGRLGTIALATARYLDKTNNIKDTVIFARKAVRKCEEYVFLDKLQYLAAGGRLSKSSAFFGDMLKMKPVISPQPEGAKKVGVVRNQEGQVKMALAKLAVSLQKNSCAVIMLEYSDNRKWVEAVFKPMIVERYPNAEIILQPLSLTSGAHMGPGTWAVAFLPYENSETGGQ